MADDKLAFWMSKAMLDPAQKPEFFRVLLQSTIFVVGEIEGAAGESVISRPANISIASRVEPDGTTFVPFFSALDKLQNFIVGEAAYLSFSARKLFEATRGATLALNPSVGVGGGWVFKADTIENLMAHGTDTPPSGRR